MAGLTAEQIADYYKFIDEAYTWSWVFLAGVEYYYRFNLAWFCTVFFPEIYVWMAQRPQDF